MIRLKGRYLMTLVGTFLMLITSCGTGGSLNSMEDISPPIPDTFLITKGSQLIGGPMATGRLGDVILKNDRIRIILEQPGKTPWVGNFGGGIIDADLVRGDGRGEDNFQFMHPIINIEWTENVFDREVVEDGSGGGRIVFRTRAFIDAYDYLDFDFLSPVAKAMTGEALYFDSRFDDVSDPFSTTDLKDLDPVITTDYTLEPGANYVKIETTFTNRGDKEISFPVGDLVNGGGEAELLIPGLGFTPDTVSQIQGTTPAVIYMGFEGDDVSYGYFYNIKDFVSTDENGMVIPLKTTSLTYSGVTGVLLGEDILKTLPLGGHGNPTVNFSIPPNSKRTITRYFVVGDANPGTVFDTGLEILGISKRKVGGVVRTGDGRPVAGALVAARNEDGATVITWRTRGDGSFSGYLSTGANVFDRLFGSGKYTISVYKEGYGISDTALSGSCDPEDIDIRLKDAPSINCTLGETGIVEIVGGVIDEASQKNIPARLSIVGYRPSFKSKTGGIFEDRIIFERPLGIVDVFYINKEGTIGLDKKTAFRLPPGSYDLVFSRGVEYSMKTISVKISGGEDIKIGPVKLKKVVDTSGFVSSDFHLHSIVSPDSAMRPERRVLAAAGEGMDIIQSSDHDFLINYAPYIEELAGEGIVDKDGFITAITGQEVSPNHIGHINLFPLKWDPTLPSGGALDWSFKDSDLPYGPGPDYVMSPQDIVDWARANPLNPIIQVNHIADQVTSIPIVCGWVTTPLYYDAFRIPPLTSYADPASLRIHPKASAINYPYPFGSSDTVITDFDTIELVIGPELHDNLLLTSALPTWFNLLNLGLIYTATGDSDSHREIADPIGAPRNFVASNFDPQDGVGEVSQFSIGEYLESIRKHKVIVSAGPFIRVKATNDSGETASVGETIHGKKIKLTIDVSSPSWAWFDTVEVFVNTEPYPADDTTLLPFEGVAKDPKKFFEPYHIPRYYYKPTYSFRLKDGTLKDFHDDGEKITAHIELDMNLEEDSWVVVMARGTDDTEGFKSLFPYVTRALIDADNPSKLPEDMEMGNLEILRKSGAPAWALANPIFVDTDGNGFEAMYTKKWRISRQQVEYIGGSANQQSKDAKQIQREVETIPPHKPKGSAISINKELF